MINRRLGSVQKTLNIPPTFARSSTAYNTDGTVVAANVPRFESNGVMVEEGTSNVINTVMTTWAKESNATVDLMTETYKGQPVYKVTFPTGSLTRIHSDFVASGQQAFSGSLYVKKASETQNNSTFLFFRQVGFGTTYGTKYIVLTDAWQEVKLENIIVPANAMFLLYQPVPATLTTVFYVCMSKCEAKPYATSFHPTTRTAESLTIPASALNASEGTIEFDVFKAGEGANNRYLLSLRSSSAIPAYKTLGIQISFVGEISMLWGNGTSYYQPSSGITFVVNTKYRIALRWDSVGNCSLWINGVKKCSVSGYVLELPNDFITLGSSPTGLQANALFSNLRISNKARSDAELAYTGDLRVDQFTTYSLKLTDSLTPNTF